MAYFVLDEYDKKILYELDKNSTASISSIAKKLRRSKQFVLFRMKRFEQEGIITHYSAIVDMAKLGFFTFRIYVKLQQVTREETDNLVEYLKTKENIWTIARLHGKWDIAFFIGAQKIEDVYEVWNDFLLKYKKNVEKYNFSLYSPIYNFNRTFFLDKQEQVITRIYGESKKQEISELDWKIIRTYTPEARQSILSLSKKIKVSPETIKARIKKLEKSKIICGYKIGLNINRLGYNSYRIDLTLTSTEKNKAILEYCKQHKAIYQVNKTIGGDDFEIEIVVKNLDELLDIIEDIKKQFREVIKTASYFSYSTYHLLSYIPD